MGTPADPRETAIRRTEFSKPIKRGIEEGLVGPERSFFDYGCGHGDDLARLEELGIQAAGWDPGHRPDAEIREADVVNLGFVLNVIPSEPERTQTLRRAWKLARQVLIVSARLTHDRRDLEGTDYRDGVVTGRGTFQKFFEHSELRVLISEAIGLDPSAAAPGVFFVFRDEGLRQSFLARRQRRRTAAPRVRMCDVMYETHQELLDELGAFFSERGRLPEVEEGESFEEVRSIFGSVKQGFAVLRRVTGPDPWEVIRSQRRDDLLVYLALAILGKRARFGQLESALQRDVRALCGSYKGACESADQLLFGAGDLDAMHTLTGESSVGKTTPDSFYVHVSALPSVHANLRVYEGCARHWVGHVDDANIVKLHRHRSQVSYLTYPAFERDPHPALQESLVVALDTLQIKWRDFSERENPPVLHRKETFLEPTHELHERFERLTAQEERLGLLNDSSTIGTMRGWQQRLEDCGYRMRGHRVVKKKPDDGGCPASD